MKKTGFDHALYIRTQSAHIRQRIEQFGGKLYLEFGGKLYDDNHASRVLPGFQPDSKLQMLLQLKEHAEMVIVINADDIGKGRVRGDLVETAAESTALPSTRQRLPATSIPARSRRYEKP